ncbi:hypothetical protein [Superficieibacter sp.]|uniref:hypothetical protein n=1 Tax=Superficieibacter sp. TaxID=2303322 RepID=UPI0028ABBCBC|nr:hypothetical protein [Superficieibacter sp.]
MKRRTRIHSTPKQKAIVRDRDKQGDSLRGISSISALNVLLASEEYSYVSGQVWCSDRSTDVA